MVRPAVEGTLNLLRACKDNRVRRVCVTSSVVAITMKADKPKVWDESHYSDPSYSGAGAYEKSKTFADQACWKFMAELPENERFELSAVYPCYVLGPSLVKEYKTGIVIVYNMTNKWPINGGIPNLAIGMVDVRDVALAHILCLTSDAAQGKRFIIAGGSMFFKEQAAELRKLFP